MRILHVGTELQWTKQEIDLLQLVKKLKSQYFAENWVAYPPNAEALKNFSPICPVLSLASTKPFDPRSVLRLAKWIKHNQIHLLDAHSPNALSLCLWAKKLCPAIQLVTRIHPSQTTHLKKRAQQKYCRPGVNQIIVNSPEDQAQLQAWGVPPSKIQLIAEKSTHTYISFFAPIFSGALDLS